MTATGAVGVREIDPTRSGIPAWRAFKAKPEDWFDPELIAKARRYTDPIRKVNIAKIVINLVVDLVVIGTHFIPNLLEDLDITNWFVGVVVAMLVLIAIGMVVNIPFDWWRSMVYDKRWGFSTMTAKTFVVDQLKELALFGTIQGVLVAAIWGFIRWTDYWWLFGWAAFAGLSLLFAVIGPRVIMPLFNKFKPLDDAVLSERVLSVAHGVGANIEKVEVEDTSKRSTKKNAYVAGAGPLRRMVVCDTMLDWSHEEVSWVCAHEIGHWKLRHLSKRIPLTLLVMLAQFAMLGAILTNDAILDFAGVDSLGDPGAVALFFFVFALPSLITGPITAYISRGFEREADLFGMEAVPDAAAATAAFRKMATEDLVDLSPSLWKRLTHDHPEVPERLAMIQEWERRRSA